MRSASAQGTTLPSRMPSEMPSMGTRATIVLPAKRPIRYWRREMGVAKTSCAVLLLKSRMAVPFTKAVTMSSPRKLMSA